MVEANGTIIAGDTFNASASVPRYLFYLAARLIGIGGRVTPSPLPHHRNMRVRIRRFGGLS
jgi:hypothetical protein